MCLFSLHFPYPPTFPVRPTGCIFKNVSAKDYFRAKLHIPIELKRNDTDDGEEEEEEVDDDVG